MSMSIGFLHVADQGACRAEEQQAILADDDRALLPCLMSIGVGRAVVRSSMTTVCACIAVQYPQSAGLRADAPAVFRPLSDEQQLRALLNGGRCGVPPAAFARHDCQTNNGQRTHAAELHHLRHTCLSWLGDTGANDMVIKAIAGHADADVTDRYVHVGLDAMREAVTRLEQAKLLQKNDPKTADDSSAEVG